MDYKISLAIISLAVASIALSPSLIANQPVEGKHPCSHSGHSNPNWISGCKDGWFDCDKNRQYSPGSGKYAEGYNYGWHSKGGCKIPQRST